MKLFSKPHIMTTQTSLATSVLASYQICSCQSKVHCCKYFLKSQTDSLMASFVLLLALLLKNRGLSPLSQIMSPFFFSHFLVYTGSTKQSCQKHSSTLRELVSGTNLGLNGGISPQFANPFLSLCDLTVCQSPHIPVGFILFYLLHICHEDRREQKMPATIPQFLPWTLLMSCEYSSPNLSVCLYR